jgi:hypothetical protein
MNEITNIKMLDPRLQKMLNAYGVTPERDPEATRRTQERFMAELDKAFIGQTAPKPAVGWSAPAPRVSILARLKSDLSPFIGKSVILYAVITLVVFGVFLFSGVGITVYAAASSLPGDATYPLKTTFESARAGLTIDSAAKARLYVDFAGRRLPEMQSLIDDGRYDDIAQAASEFERDIRMALNAVESLSRTDPARAASLNIEISTILRKYSNVLMQLLATVPMDVQPVIRNAIDAAQSTTGGGDSDDSAGNSDSGSNPRPTPTIISTTTPTPDSSITPGKTPGRGSDDDANGSGGGGSGDDDQGGDDDEGGDDDGDGDDDGGDDDDGSDD